MCDLSLTGLNHEIAIDVAFLPVYSPEDVRTSQIDTFLTCMNYSCVYPPEAPGHEKLPGSKAVAGNYSFCSEKKKHYKESSPFLNFYYLNYCSLNSFAKCTPLRLKCECVF